MGLVRLDILAFRRSLVEDLDRDAIFQGYGDYAIRNVCGLRFGPPGPCVLELVGSRPGV